MGDQEDNSKEPDFDEDSVKRLFWLITNLGDLSAKIEQARKDLISVYEDYLSQ